MKLHIDARQNNQIILKLHFFYGIILYYVDNLPFLKRERRLPDRQKLPSHKSIKTTMDRYVHVTDDSMTSAVRQFESNQATA